MSITSLAHENKPEKYSCPMQCEGDKVYDKPGDCPVCGMHLTIVPTASSSTWNW